MPECFVSAGYKCGLMGEDFIQQLKRRDQLAFKQLVEEYQQMVFSTCMGIVHGTDDADDLAQEVFIEAFNSIANFREDAKVSTWLYRIAINKSLNFVRDNKRNRLLQSIGILNVPDIPDDPYQYDLPYESLLEKQRSKMIQMAIDSLPTNQRTAFVLSKYDDLSYKEIAEVMKISVSSVESLLFRARKSLQKKLLNCYRKEC